jgi:hypothetical protein
VTTAPPRVRRSMVLLGTLAILFAAIDLALNLFAAAALLRSGASFATGLPSVAPAAPPGLGDALATAQRALAPFLLPRAILGFVAPISLIPVGFLVRAGRPAARAAAIGWSLAAFAVTVYLCVAAFAAAARLAAALGPLANHPALPPALHPSAEITGLYMWLATHAAFPIVLLLVAGRKRAA